jgi:hypothetical protein
MLLRPCRGTETPEKFLPPKIVNCCPIKVLFDLDFLGLSLFKSHIVSRRLARPGQIRQLMIDWLGAGFGSRSAHRLQSEALVEQVEGRPL